ncbi:MAG: enoyl-CoA hydratase-related protein [Thiofilum sp.]|uniref:enoyl-CoA hydratase-related protein n=1 Tax=Thiofilum sp. TaxID=2212733 RepID=UPI0025E0876B|nr:enoyl-CoA hydratase-related protein [Thiofilum sp.]MBK8454380.1 enoyl-CoA hydratase/isomerase family protein [Thiofilum sp.]
MSKWQTLTLIERGTGVAQVTMARPAVFNAFNEVMIAEIQAVFAELMADPKVRIIVLAGEGKHFSAGADLQWMRRASEASQEWNLEDARRLAQMLHTIESCPKPTIARINGAALGGGVGLVCACDIAIAADNATFTLSEAKFGIVPAVISPYVINAVGRRQAKRLALTTTRIGAHEALELGLVHQVVSSEALDKTVDMVIADVLLGSPNAHQEIKWLFNQLSPSEITPEVRELTAQTISRVRGTEEAREGFAAFLAKRPASWLNQSE